MLTVAASNDVGCSCLRRQEAGCDEAGGWCQRGGWLQRLQSLAANEVLLVAASGKGRSRRSVVWWAGGDEIMIL